MTETELYARVGRQAVTIEQQQAAYARLLDLLGKVVSGEVDRSRVLVNLTAQTWVVSEPNTSPATPPTFNGLPRCVVAPAPPPEIPAAVNGRMHPEPAEQ